MPDQEPLVLLFAGHFQVRGSCAYTLRLLEHLPHCGVRAEMACICSDRIPEHRRRGLTIHDYPHLDIPLLNRLVVRELARVYRRKGAALLHVQTRAVARLGRWLANDLELPYVLTVHDFLGPRQRLPLHRRRCQKVIAVSEAVRDGLIERGQVPESLIEVIRSGVDVPERLPERRPRAGRIPVIGTAGPLERVKGQQYFLEAARRVLDTGRDAEFVIAGTGPEETNLRRLARRLGIEPKVTFITFVQEYGPVLEPLDLFVLPSLQQGLGTVMLEAMALGKPVIATRVGGVQRVVRHQQTGLLVPQGDPEALAQAMCLLLEDREEAERLATAARQQVAQCFHARRMAAETAELYRRVIAQRCSVPG